MPQRAIGDPRVGRSAVTVGPAAASEFALDRESVDLGERNLHLVQRRLATLVGAGRLGGGADETSGEQVRQRGMPLPIGQHRHEQIGAAQHRRIGRLPAAEGDVITTAGAAVAAVEIETLGTQSHMPGVIVERLQQCRLLGEAVGGLDVHLDHTGIGGDRETLHPAVGRRTVTLDDDAGATGGRSRLDAADDGQELLEGRGRRQEHIQHPGTHLGDNGRPRNGCAGIDVDDPAAERGGRIVGQIPGGRRRVGFEHDRRRTPGQRAQRQPQTGRRGPRGEHETSASERPVGALPGLVVLGSAQRQHIGGGDLDGGVQPIDEGLARRSVVDEGR